MPCEGPVVCHLDWYNHGNFLMKTFKETNSDKCPNFEMPEMPRPLSEHDWLQQLVGEWESEAECFIDPDGPPLKCKGRERIRALGGFWIVSEIEAEMIDRPFKTVQILGFDPHKERFIGSWVDSMNSFMWHYEGALNDTRNTLVLDTEGPCPMRPGGHSKFREMLEIRDHGHKIYTSSVLDEDGHWNTCLIANAHRV
jgi:hypothetical protein